MNMFRAFGDPRIKIVAAGAAIAALALGVFKIYDFGYQNAVTKLMLEQAKKDKAAQKAIIDAQNQAKAIEKITYLNDLKTIQELENKNLKLSQNISKLQREAVKYVPQEIANHKLSYDFVRVFDSAVEGSNTNNRDAAAPDATTKPIGGNSAPSNINGMEQIQYSIAIAGQYNQARNQCNALIAWVKTNVVGGIE